MNICTLKYRGAFALAAKIAGLLPYGAFALQPMPKPQFFFSVNAFDMIRLYKADNPLSHPVFYQCYPLSYQCRSIFSKHHWFSDCVTRKPHLLINPYDKELHNRVFKLSVKRFYVFEFGVLPAPVYNPHPGVLFVKSVYNPRVIHR